MQYRFSLLFIHYTEPDWSISGYYSLFEASNAYACSTSLAAVLSNPHEKYLQLPEWSIHVRDIMVSFRIHNLKLVFQEKISPA